MGKLFEKTFIFKLDLYLILIFVLTYDILLKWIGTRPSYLVRSRTRQK